jgi:hypothetical protein
MNVTAPIPPPAVTFDCDFHFLVVLAEEFGFEGRDAFLTAMLLRASGINATGAVKLFQDARRWLQ